MCGISCTIRCTDGKSVSAKYDKLQREQLDFLEDLLKHRGPDLSTRKFFSRNFANYDIELSAHVLWTQGGSLSAQPFCDDIESKFLLFNGDIYSFDSETSDSLPNFSGQNDGDTLFKCLSNCGISSDSHVLEFKNIIGNLKGPFAFIYYDKDRDLILFGRDFFGRESLLLSTSSDGMVKVLSSVTAYKNVFEIPAAGIYHWDLKNHEISLYRFECQDRKDITNNLEKFRTFLENVDIHLRMDTSSEIKLQFSTFVKIFSIHEESINEHEKLEKVKLCAESSNDNVAKVLEDISVILSEEVEGFLQVLRNAVSLRVKCQPNFCKNCILTRTNCLCSKVAILFSGGLDSTVLAYLALESLTSGESLDLINVGFSKDGTFVNIPDRETGLESYKILKSIFEPQGKTVNFISADIKKEEVEIMREKNIRNLISPLTSVLDDSLGCCLWFAARCSGILHETNTFYTSPARVVLLGSGADELLGGYGRHRTAYNLRGWVGLASEMQKDIDRISVRNLGRDNRIVSDHGVCPRMPYLDEDVVTFVTNSDIWVKCCPLNIGVLGTRGLGEKLLLRATALKILGKENWSLAVFPKRAMQFGSRIAKLENSKEKGSDKCSRLMASTSTVN